MSEIETLRRQTETLQNQFAEVSAMVSTLMRQAEEQRQHYDAEIAKKDAKIEEQAKEILKLKQNVAWFVRKFYGKVSEKVRALDKNQLTIPFPEWQDEPTAEIEKMREEVDKKLEKQREELKSTQAKKPRSTRSAIKNPSYPVVTVVVEPDGVDMSNYKIVGHEYTEKVEIVPGKVYVLRIDRPVYGLVNGQVLVPEGQKGMMIAKLPPMIIGQGMFGNNAIVEFMLDKFAYYMPYYRQHQKYLNLGVDLKKTTLEGCFKPVAELLKPLAEELSKAILNETGYVQCDGTTIPVVNKEKHKACKEYIWTLRAPLLHLVRYNYLYEGSRGGKVGEELLGNYKDYLQTDDYEVYRSLCGEGKACHAGCLAHLRRYIEKAKDENAKVSNNGLYIIQQLYEVEHIADAKKLNYDQRRDLRQRLSAPLLDALEQWAKDTANLKEVQYRPKGLLGRAAMHILSNIDTMRTYLQDGRIEIDNNGCERAQKNIIIGRKNWLFAGNHEAAANICVITSLIASCKECGVNPRKWLLDVATKMAGRRDYHWNLDLRSLLPDKWVESNDNNTLEAITANAFSNVCPNLTMKLNIV